MVFKAGKYTVEINVKETGESIYTDAALVDFLVDLVSLSAQAEGYCHMKKQSHHNVPQIAESYDNMMNQARVYSHEFEVACSKVWEKMMD